MRTHYFQVRNSQFGLNKNFFRKNSSIFLIYLLSHYIINAKYKEKNQEKLKACKIHLPQTARQMSKGRERGKNWENTFLKRFFENGFYLIHFSCGLVPYHHTKFKLKFKSQKSKNKQICSGA